MRIAGALGAVFDPDVARIQPAALVRDLAEAVERLDVPIYEGTAVTAIEPRVARTDHGDVRAAWIVRATEGYTAGLPGLRRLIIPLRSTIVITDPLPDGVWSEIGWDGAETIADAALAYAYIQRTADGRIAIGGRGRPYYWRSGARPLRRGGELGRAAAGRRSSTTLWPATRGVPIAQAWSGVFGALRDWMPIGGR